MFRNSCIVQNVMYAPYRIKPAFVQGGESAGYSLSCMDLRRKVQAGDELEFRLILYGDRAFFFQPILQAIYGLGIRGIGNEHLPFSILKIQNVFREDVLEGNNIRLNRIRTLEIWDYIRMRKEEIGDSNEIFVQFLSPFALSYQGKLIEELTAEVLIQSVWRRVYMQHLFEGILVEPNPILEMPVLLEQTMRSCTVGRYSERSEEKTKLRGIIGWAKIGNVSEELLKVLLAGEVTCIGKNIRFGFGVYRLMEQT